MFYTIRRFGASLRLFRRMLRLSDSDFLTGTAADVPARVPARFFDADLYIRQPV